MDPIPDLRPGDAGLRISFAPPAAMPGDAAWTRLVAAASEPNPFFEPWFLRPALAHLAKDQPIRVAQAWAGDHLVGLMPLAIRHRYGRIPVSHSGNWGHYQCFLGTPLIWAGAERAFWQALIAALDDEPWASNFLSVTDLDPDGPVCAALLSCDRQTPIVHSRQRALLASDLDGEAYLTSHVRPKKRKEWRRLSHRMAEMGTLVHSSLSSGDDLAQWCAAFMALEAAGWKGDRGAAMANTDATRAFFDAMMQGAWSAGRLAFQRIDLNGEPIAMLINFHTPPGSWSFKIAHDARLARFSPGVMIELENLIHVLADPAIDWMDSCAVENHPMIDSLWAERRRLVQVSVPLSGARRRAVWAVCRTAETASAKARTWRDK
ncbi:MAG: hypothetical protein RL367_2607 [Pseudomonadota bacterium]